MEREKTRNEWQNGEISGEIKHANSHEFIDPQEKKIILILHFLKLTTTNY
jgi:hypothetical protein